MTIIDYIVLCLYLLGVAWLGTRFSKEQHSTEDFFLGGRNIPWWAIGLSVMATQASAITFIGAPGWGYEGGLERITTYINVPLAVAFVVSTLIPFFYRAQIFTAYEYLENRFGSGTRTTIAVVFLVARGLATGVILYTPSLVLSVMTGWSVSICILIMAFLSVSYTVMGGISAVIWTDVVQMVFLWFGTGISIFLVLKSVPGGLEGVVQVAQEKQFLNALNPSWDITETYTLFAGLLGGVIWHISYFGTDQSQVQRMLTAKSENQAKQSLMIAGLLMVPQMLLFLWIGIMLYVFYQDRAFDNVNQVFPTFIVEELPMGITGLVIAGVFAAAMSSLDSVLNSLAAVSVKDIYSRYIKRNASENHYLKVSRWLTIGWGLYATIAAFFVENMGSVIEAVNKIGSFFYGPILGIFLLALLTRRISGSWATVGLLGGVVAVFAVDWLTNISWLFYNVIGVVVCLVLASLGRFLAPLPIEVAAQYKDRITWHSLNSWWTWALLLYFIIMMVLLA
ncbi:Sodium:solute symporter [Hyella patelloides LEGE 07179]|uniref:Sodium:solute symporter n=1 Tax=Hyella patelloides LEGE 07179 TaxID=945734 RepID=A0A563VU47_9CYAN|nr:sodium:solute symporter [Hyella patelloides]VEP14914.1 Sodium:solute symporter [Hyella patelloides LEGE 07179]